VHPNLLEPLRVRWIVGALLMVVFLGACDRDLHAQRALAAGDTARARSSWNKVLTKDQHHEGALYGLAWIALMDGQRHTTRTMSTTCLEHHPNAARCWRVLGLLEAVEGNLADARTAYEQALAHGEDDPKNWVAFGAFEADRGDLERAQELVERAIALAPNVGDYRLPLADIAMRRQDPQAALDLLNEAQSRGFRDMQMELQSWMTRAWVHVVLAEQAATPKPPMGPDIGAVREHLEQMESSLVQAERFLGDSPSPQHRTQIANVRSAGSTLQARIGRLWELPGLQPPPN